MVNPVISSEFVMPGGLGVCLPPLLDALGWRGSDGNLAEAMPHLRESLDLSDVLNVMANIKFGSRSLKTRLRQIDERTYPCLFVADDGNVFVLLKSDGNTILAFDAAKEAYTQLQPDGRTGTAYFFAQVDAHGHSLHRQQEQWFRKVVSRFAVPLKQALFVSFMLSVLALSMPLFIMIIYDQMPFFESNVTLGYIVAGVFVFILSDFGLRLIRSGVLSFIAARMGNIVSNEVLRRILYMPPSYTESASIGAQASRIRDFDTVRDFFSGQAFVAILELPFIVLLIIAMWVLGGSVVAVPLVAIGCFLGLAAFYLPQVKRANEQAAKSNAARHELVVEILTKMRAIKQTATPAVWKERYKQICAECAANTYNSLQLTSQINVLTNSLIMGSGVATIAISVNNVLAREMSMGALVACMILVWRVLAPLRSGFVVMLQVERIAKSVRQVDRLMELEIEQHIESQHALKRQMQGDVLFSHVSIRYVRDAQPALLGVDFHVEHGGRLAITGHDGAGKSTILKLVMGLYKPQAGRITLDHISIRQMDPLTLRRSIGYVPQMPQFFYGTIAQNLRMTNPLATEEELLNACLKAGVLSEVQAKQDGINTRIGDYQMKLMPSTFLKKLNLARTLLRPSSLLLFDEAMEKPTQDEQEAFLNILDSARGDSTVIMVTNHRPYLQAADNILWLERGRVRMFAPAHEVLPHLPQDYAG